MYYIYYFKYDFTSVYFESFEVSAVCVEHITF